MSLNICLRVPDGIVIAADSLASTMSMLRLSSDARLKAKCPSCKQDIDLEKIELPPIPAPATTRSFAQKLFPFFDRRFAVATYGAGIIASKTVYYHIRELEQKLKAEKTSLEGVSQAADIIGKYFIGLSKPTAPEPPPPPRAFLLGLLIAGYDGQTAKTISMKIGTEVTAQAHEKAGVSFGGDGLVVQGLWQLWKTNRPIFYGNLSLQDAIDYAEFLIDTTAKFQRFSNAIPSVGGEVDIALVTVYDGFRWIKVKRIQHILEEQHATSHRHDT